MEFNARAEQLFDRGGFLLEISKKVGSFGEGKQLVGLGNFLREGGGENSANSWGCRFSKAKRPALYRTLSSSSHGGIFVADGAPDCRPVDVTESRGWWTKAVSVILPNVNAQSIDPRIKLFMPVGEPSREMILT